MKVWGSERGDTPGRSSPHGFLASKPERYMGLQRPQLLTEQNFAFRRHCLSGIFLPLGGVGASYIEAVVHLGRIWTLLHPKARIISRLF